MDNWRNQGILKEAMMMTTMKRWLCIVHFCILRNRLLPVAPLVPPPLMMIYSKFSDDFKQLISLLTKELSSKSIAWKIFCFTTRGQKRMNSFTMKSFLRKHLIFISLSVKGETRLLLHQIVLKKAKLQLTNMKWEQLLEKLQILNSRIQVLQMLKMSSLSRFLKTCAANIKADAVSCHSFPIDSENRHEGVYDKLTTTRQGLEASERKITNLNRTFHASRKIKGEPSCDDTIALVNECLMKRACCRFIRLYMQIWVVHSVESMNGQQNVVLNYLDFAVQSLKVTMGPASPIKISFKLNDGNIIKNFPNMDSCSAFEFVFDADIRRKYAGVRTVVTETQVTSFLLGTLLDVLEEVQLAQLELPNLNQSSFYGPSADQNNYGHPHRQMSILSSIQHKVEQHHLQLCFIKLISGRKVTLTLDMSCLKRGIYPSDALPLHLAAPAHEPQYSSLEPALAEIRDAVKKVSNGYMRIFRLCKCVSEVLQASNAQVVRQNPIREIAVVV